MSQSRRMSAMETCLSTAIGYAVAMATQAVVFPLFGIHASASAQFEIALIFTGVSILRGYAVRRFFVFLHGRTGRCSPP